MQQKRLSAGIKTTHLCKKPCLNRHKLKDNMDQKWKQKGEDLWLNINI